jgi:electron transport complex protein RnfE
MGLGATLALVLMGGIREILGNGTFFGLSIPVLQAGGAIQPMLVFILPPGGFFVFGILIALTIKVVARMDKKAESRVRAEMAAAGCAGCPSASLCGKAGDASCEGPEPEVSTKASSQGGDKS